MLLPKNSGIIFLVVALTIFFDQLSKYLVVNTGVLYTLNSDIAFNIPLGNSLALVLGTLICLAIGLYSYKTSSLNGYLTNISLGLIMGGAVGNLIDRVRFESVIDFIKVPYWPAFNLADAAVFFGVLFLVFRELRGFARS